MLSEAILKPLRSGNLLLTVFSIDSPTSVPGKCQSLLKIKFLKSLARTADPYPHNTTGVQGFFCQQWMFDESQIRGTAIGLDIFIHLIPDVTSVLEVTPWGNFRQGKFDVWTVLLDYLTQVFDFLSNDVWAIFPQIV